MEVVFADANVMFSACYKVPNYLEDLWSNTSLQMCTSPYCISEVRRHLTEPAQLNRLSILLERTRIVEDCPEHELPKTLMLPAKDVPVLAAAARCKADTLVTGDLRHFGPFFGQRVFGVLVESPKMLRNRLEQAGT